MTQPLTAFRRFADRLWTALDGHMATVLALAMAVLALWPALAAPGLVATRAAGDSPFLLQRSFEMALALSSGHLPPRWMPDAAYGLGYPFWNFYAPLAYLASGALAATGASLVGAVKAAWLLAFLVGALGAYRLGRLTWRRPSAGLVVSAAYTLAPYHLVNVYVRGDALGEVLAYGLVPWVLVAVHDVFSRPGGGVQRRTDWLPALTAAEGSGIRSVLALSAALALLLVSHNITALLAAPMIAAYALWRLVEADRAGRRRTVAPSVGGQSDAPEEFLPGEAGRSPIPPPPVLQPAAARAAVRAKPAGTSMWGVPARLVARLLDAAEASRWRARLSPRLRSLVVLTAGGVLGLGLAAWFWLPALVEGRYVQLEQNLSGYFDYAGHFRSLPQLLSVAVPFDYAAGEDCAPCRAGLVQVVLAFLGLALALVRARRPQTGTDRPEAAPDRVTVDHSPIDAGYSSAMFWFAIALASTLLMTALSAPLWRSLPLLAYAQFPWRWLGVQSLALAVLAGGLLSVAGDNRDGSPGGWGGRLAAVVVTLALAAAMLPALRHIQVLTVGDVTRDDLLAFELFSGNVGSTVRAEYLPAGIAPRPLSASAAVWGRPGIPRAVDASSDISGATLLRQGAAWQEWQVRLPTAATVAFPMFWFPGLEAQVGDGPWQPAGRVEGSGWAKVPLAPADCPPDGTCRVLLQLGRSGLRALAEGLSLLAALAWLALWLADRRRRIGQAATLVAVAAALSVGAAYWLPAGKAAGPVTLDFERMPFPHANPGGLTFGQATLVSASVNTPPGDVSAEAAMPSPSGSATAAPDASSITPLVAPGEEVTLNLTWKGLKSGTRVEAALVSPAEIMFSVPYLLAKDERRAPEVNTFLLPVSQDVPPGLYFVRLMVFDNTTEIRPRDAGGFALGTTYLGPVRVTGSGFVGPPDAVAVMGDVWLLKLSAKVDGEPDARATDRTTESGGSAGPAAQRVVVDMTWRAVRPLAQDYQTSVRLVDRAGNTITHEGASLQEDKQPGYGFLPTTSWAPGVAIQDRRWVDVPAGVNMNDIAGAEVVLYDLASTKEIGRAKTGLGR